MGATRPPCMVCKAAEGKYKCPSCYEYSCSLACSKEHRNNHPAVDSKPKVVKSEPMDITASDISSPVENGADQDLSKRSGIADMPEYKALLRKYPNLERLLWDIAVATDPPTNNGSFPKAHGGRKANQPWTKDMGYENAADMLRRTREAPGDDRDALKEYCELVRHYAAKREQIAATNDRHEFAEANSKTIKELLQAEKQEGSL